MKVSGHVAGLCALAVVACVTASASAQSYTFTSGFSGDGFDWPDSPPGLLPGESFFTPDGVQVYSYIGNNLFFDDNYLLPNHLSSGNGITTEALWGNPTNADAPISEAVYFFFDPVNSVSFDFAWAVAGQHASSQLELYVDDGTGNGEFIYVDLFNSFNAGGPFGGFDGYSQNVYLDLDTLFNDYGVVLDHIGTVQVFVGPVSTPGAVGAFAIDNFTLNGSSGGGGPDLDPDNSDITLSAISTYTNRLTTSQGSTFSFGTDVNNWGTGGTTYSFTLDPSSNPAFVAFDKTGEYIAGETTDADVFIAEVNMQNRPSGAYHASATLVNELNPNDDDDVVLFELELYDAPSLTDDTGSTFNPLADNDIFIANAAPAGHAGALRAGVKVTGTSFTGIGSRVNGIDVGDFVAAGTTMHGALDLANLLSGTYTGTFTVALQMGVTRASFLNGAQAVANRVWNINFTITDKTAATSPVAPGENFADIVETINSDKTAAGLIAGTSSSTQTVNLAFAANPETGGSATALIVGDTVDLHFSEAGNLFVLQLVYDDAGIADESVLELMVYDTATSAWVNAVVLNSDGGAGAAKFFGSFADFIGDGELNPTVLSVYGVDADANTVWAVLDHNSLFAAGFVPEPATLGLLAAGLVLLSRRR